MKSKFCMSKAPLTWTTLALHMYYTFCNWDDAWIENLPFSFWAKIPIDPLQELAIVTKPNDMQLITKGI